MQHSPLLYDFANKVEYTWHPDGERILFSGVPLPAEDDFFSDVWIIDSNNQEARNLDRLGKFLEFLGWLDSDTLVYHDHWGAANWQVYFLDIKADKELASAYIHGSSVNTFTTDYAVGNDISSEASSSAVSLFREIINPESQYSPYIKVLSRDFADSCCEYAFNSVALDLLPKTNQVLIRTWDASEYLTNTLSIETDLQLWDVETDELTMLIPDGINGKFSPNGRFLAYKLFGEENPPLHLLDRNSGEILFVEPAKRWSESFSPNGRFLTFYSPTPELMIYDLESGQFLPPIAGVPFTPLWSPDNSRFVYEDANNGFSIYEIETGATYPLAASGGERLLDPQWSFDGTYLSVVVSQGDGEMKTAVLELP